MLGHVSHAKGERNDENDGQPFGNNGHENCDGHNKLVHHDGEQITLSIDDGLAELNADDDHRNEQSDEPEKPAEGLQFMFEWRLRRLCFLNV